MGRRVGAGLAAALAVAASALAAAPAGAVVSGTVSGDDLFLVGDGAADRTTVVFDFSNGTVDVSGSPGSVAPGGPCTGSSSEIACSAAWTEGSRLTVRLGGGNDAFQDGFLLFFPLPIEVHGEAGDDQIAFSNPVGLLSPDETTTFAFGGAGDDAIQAAVSNARLDGGGGRDTVVGVYLTQTLIGGGGADLLAGGDGRDRYVAGAGADRIKAKDFTRDLSINCGPGKDKLKRDRFDPVGKSCP